MMLKLEGTLKTWRESGDKSRVESRTGTCQQLNANQNLESDLKILDNF